MLFYTNRMVFFGISFFFYVRCKSILQVEQTLSYASSQNNLQNTSESIDWMEEPVLCSDPGWRNASSVHTIREPWQENQAFVLVSLWQLHCLQAGHLDLVCAVSTYNVPVVNRLKLCKVDHWRERNEHTCFSPLEFWQNASDNLRFEKKQ